MSKVLVIGAARSGIAVSRLLKEKGYEVLLTDMKTVEQKAELEQLGIKVYDEGHPDFLKNTDYEFVVKNPGIPYRVEFIQYFLKNNVPIYTEIEIAYRFSPNFKYGAITGTDGKTTITTLLYEMLKKNQKALVAGNIGTPLSELVLEYGDQEKDVALELSNFQLLGMNTFKPVVSTVSNLAPDHLDYMDSLEEYYSSKMKIYENCDANDYFIRNVDDVNVVKYAQNIPCQVIDFSLSRTDVDLYCKDHYAYYKDTVLFDIRDLKIVGPFNCGNAMMASCMAYLMGVSLKDIQDVIKNFKGVEHRIEYVATIDDVRYYNDTKATNTHAACAALSAFEGNLILLCGGKDKHISFDDMKAYDSKVKHCFSFGQTKDKFKDIFTNQTSCQTMEEAFKEAVTIAKPGDVVLLSPACSSFDQFKNYEVRGEIYKQYVLDYAKKRS
ncbi:UDP-N-acetylmuramoyl-L-alanine--D-glutamate ligase [Floccifex sp.]|uniref:UDP-N-acetylmuramoyl-L-alanine--D-glutamate ligase n=1 Tax=Floccifex sp. TaxID=2815810 RepID=UPI002A7546DD|nr:UDP-N-acetylmuramoyl-L-alanine--D-glutamate ligase [Floccifex sp.]MDD7281181.1 UDP-N-acetylmuramoyl-L-alanine--D-glutamate ligase [Erysipelotrichaceae bacterium]MDY2958695.1 UDP-N-acetylmuramoyl-L-alanine--D-glutamate ligase [Floccifex sp.]